MCAQVETPFAAVARPPSIAGLLCPTTPRPLLSLATERCQNAANRASLTSAPSPTPTAAEARNDSTASSQQRRKRVMELESKREDAIRRCRLEQIHNQRLAERKVWLEDCSAYLYRRPKLAFMFIETATTVFGGRRDRLMVWAFEQYETYIAYHAPLSPFERSRWLVATALRTAHPYADLSALDTEEHVDCVSSLPLARTAPVVRQLPPYARRAETPLLQRVLINNMLSA